MPTIEAACRARHLKQLLRSVDRLPAPSAASIRAAMEPAHLQQIDEGAGLEWLPLDVHVALTRAIHAALGEAQFQQFHRSHFAGVFRGPVYRAVIEGAAAVFGFDPHGWMRLLPEAWTLSFRQCGTWSIERVEPALVALRLSNLPRACVVDRIWPLAVASSVSATLDLAAAAGAVAVTAVGLQRRDARFEMRWSRP